MRTRHTSHTLPAFPVYSSAFLADDLLALGGGGGSGKSGVKNRIVSQAVSSLFGCTHSKFLFIFDGQRLYRIENDEKLEMLDELQLGDEDAPMSMAVCLNEKELACGINSPIDELQKGKNENCRIYRIMAQKIKLCRKCGTFQSDNAEDYQNVTAFSSDHSLLAIGSTKNEVTLRWYDSLAPAAPPIQLQRGQLYDTTFSPTSVVVAATTHLDVYSLPKALTGKKKKLEALSLLKTVNPPTSPVQGLTFRAARFHPTQPGTIYTVLNASPPRVRGKPSPRPAYICKWDTNTWQMIKMRKVAEKGVTCFDVSADGKLVAFGSSDYTIGILDSQTLVPVLTILRAHDFPPTTLRFNPEASLLISGSADNTVRIIVVPKNFGNSWTTTMIIMMTLVVLMLAIAMKQGMIF